jgi:large subunit ribosomal protein L1
MGQKKIKTVGEEAAKSDKKKKEEKGQAKKVRLSGLKGGERVRLVEAEPIEIKRQEPVEEEKKPRKIKVRGKNYLQAKKKINPDKFYALAEAVKLVKETSLSKFVGNLEAHLVVNETGEIAEVSLPYFKAKQKKVVVANDKVVEKIKAGKIDFDVLLASPKMMPKLVPFARVLGPKGLMPNPKNGTLVNNPEEAAKKFSGGAMRVKTEKKAPVVHLNLGKLDQPDEELVANLEALIKAIGKAKIKKMTVCATMGPGVKVKIQN